MTKSEVIIEPNPRYVEENSQWFNALFSHVSKGYRDFYEHTGNLPDKIIFNSEDFPQLTDKKIYILGVEVMSTHLVQSGTMICVDSSAFTIFD